MKLKSLVLITLMILSACASKRGSTQAKQAKSESFQLNDQHVHVMDGVFSRIR
jgi:hypothetical protein